MWNVNIWVYFTDGTSSCVDPDFSAGCGGPWSERWSRVVLGVSGDHVGDCSSTCLYCAISCRLRGYRFGECLAIGFCPPSAPYRCVCRVVSVSDVIHQNIHHSSNASVWSQLHIRILLHKLLLLMSFAYWILIFWNSYHCWWPR